MNTHHNIQRDARLLEISNTIAKLKREIQELYEPNVISKFSEEVVEEILVSHTSELESTMPDEELERGINDYFDYLAFKETPEYRQKIGQRIETLLQENVDVVNSYRQSDNRSRLKEKNYNLVKNYLLQHWSEGMKLTYIDDCMVRELGLSLRCVQEHRNVVDLFSEFTSTNMLIGSWFVFSWFSILNSKNVGAIVRLGNFIIHGLSYHASYNGWICFAIAWM